MLFNSDSLCERFVLLSLVIFNVYYRRTNEGKLHVRYSIGGALVAAVINKLVRVAARWMCMVVVCRSLFNAATLVIL